MPAYIIFYCEKTTDPEEIKTYRSLVRATMAGRTSERRVAYGRCRTVEGTPIEGVAMLEFPTFEEAESWYDSAEYQEVLKHRLAGAVYHSVIVESA